MAKFALLFATFALFLLVANASIYRTTIEIDEDDNQQEGKCRREFQRHQQLRSCQQFMRQRVRGGGGYADDLNDDESNPRPQLRQCCNQLRQIDEECVCPVLGQAIQQQRLQGQLQGQEVRQLYSVARNIPSICNIPTRSCQFGSSPY